MFEEIFKKVSKDITNYFSKVFKEYDADNWLEIAFALKLTYELTSLKINCYKLINEIKADVAKERKERNNVIG